MKRFRLLLCAIVLACACNRPANIDLPDVPPPTPIPVDFFDFPLDPTRFGPYVYNVSGPLNVDTRFGVQNPGLGIEGKCFVDLNEEQVPFSRLYHAGEDWFALDVLGQVVPGLAAHAPVKAIAHGVVSWTQSTGGEGDIVVVEHRLQDSTSMWSAYWHLESVQVLRGQTVNRGDTLGRILDRGFNSHLHWEIRQWSDGSNLFSSDSAGARGTCNGRIPGLAYTWDDDLSRALPEYWGYVNPIQFVQGNR